MVSLCRYRPGTHVTTPYDVVPGLPGQDIPSNILYDL
uniref:Uncharacterized protein n=1 Tax=Musa acuminata subsp. malaccensis TaxID=214687 RepID=A0A804IC43_MUSAM